MPLANACPDAPRIENAVMFVPKSDSRKINGPRLRPARKYCSAAPPDDEPDRPPNTPMHSTTARYAKTTPAAIIYLPGGFAPPDPPARSLAGTPYPAPFAWLASLRSLASSRCDGHRYFTSTNINSEIASVYAA